MKNKNAYYEQIIQQQGEEIEKLKKQNHDYAMALEFLTQNVDIDMIKTAREYNDLIRQTKQALDEIKEIKNKIIQEKAQYQKRMDEALKNIIG